MKICLIGEKLSYSYSPFIHKNFGYKYFCREVPLDEFDFFARYNDLDGYNVTVPYKKKILPYLDWISKEAEEIGSVNTVVKKDGKSFGYNTDAFGLDMSLSRHGVDLASKTVMILGSGGTCSTAKFVAKKHGAKKIYVVSRTGEINYENAYLLQDVEVIINTTPVGTSPNLSSSPIDLSRFKSLVAVIDVVYNPNKTALVLQAEELGVKAVGGLYMLVAQAKCSAELFLNCKIDDAVIEDVYRKVNKKYQNIVLVGMPGCGKSRTGIKLAERLNREFIDTDTLVKKRNGMSPEEMILKYGEEYFRQKESEVVLEVSLLHGKIIATGGGSLLKEENRKLLKHNGFAVFIDREISKLSLLGRPLSKDVDNLEELYKYRYPIYEEFADLTVVNSAYNDKYIKEITEKINEYFNN